MITVILDHHVICFKMYSRAASRLSPMVHFPAKSKAEEVILNRVS